MSIVKAVHKIILDDRDDVFLVSDYELQKQLRLTLLDVNKCEAFTGSISDAELRSHAAKIRMSYEIFKDLTTKALTQNQFDEMHFLYCLQKNCQDYIFKWKSVDADETTTTIGIVTMCKSDYQYMIKDVLVLISRELLNLSKKVIAMETDLINSQKKKEETKQLLAEATNAKERIENELYSKFVLVLNEKKRKIRELSGGTGNEVSKKVKMCKSKPSKISKNRVHQISDSDSEDVDDNVYRSNFLSSSSDDNVHDLKSDDNDNKVCDMNIPGPSKAKQDTSLLFLDEDSPKVLVSPCKVRNRKVAAVSVVKDLPQGVQATLSQICDSDSDDDLLKNL